MHNTTLAYVELKISVKRNEKNGGPARWLGLAWLGLAWLGLAWLGLAWLGLAWLGLAWLGLQSCLLVPFCQVLPSSFQGFFRMEQLYSYSSRKSKTGLKILSGKAHSEQERIQGARERFMCRCRQIPVQSKKSRETRFLRKFLLNF